MKWENYTVGELCIRVTDGSHFSPKEVGEGYPMASSKDMLENDFDYSSIKRISESDYNKLVKGDCKPLKDDILIIKDGNSYLKYIFAIKDEKDLVVLSSIAILRPNKELVNPLFFQSLLRAPQTKEAMSNYVSGAAIPRIVLKDFKQMKVSIPPLPTQRKIADILSAYDDLIENSLKRIKLLEEMAQLHYKELMQEMSYANSNREEYIKDCLSFYIGGGWGEGEYKEKFTEPAYVIRGTDIPETSGGNVSGIPLRFHKVSNLESRKMRVGDIVFEISNGQINNIGRTVLISKRLLGQFDQPVMCASFAKLIRVNEKVSPEYFYLYLNEGQENGLLYQYKSNSANGINNFAFETFIDEVKITIPKESELKAFTEKVKTIFTLISTLGEQNTKLREARDILLPRLMNGQIEV